MKWPMKEKLFNFGLIACGSLCFVGGIALTSYSGAKVSATTLKAGLPTAQIQPLLVNLLGQSVSLEDQIQNGINAAIASGQPTYTLPNQTIALSRTLLIPRNAKNFTLLGQPGTILTRNNTVDIPMIVVGRDDTAGYQNSAFNDNSRVAISPVLEGSSTLVRTGGPALVSGWYAILGTSLSEDAFRRDGMTSRFFGKRELIFVTSVNGNTAKILQPLSRDFASPELRFIQPANAGLTNRQIPENIRISGFTLKGRNTVNGVWVNKMMVVNRANNVKIDNLKLEGFNNAAISISMSKGISVDNIAVSDGNQSSLGYGVEVYGSRYVTIRNSNFRQLRWATLFHTGTSDVLVEDCKYEGDLNGGFDCSHGGGEKRITFRRVLAPIFSICNPTWLRGANDITLENCTATRQMNIYANAENIKISGMYPGYDYTARQIFFMTEGGRAGAIPSGIFGPKSVYLSNGALRRNVAEGTTIYFVSTSGLPAAVGYIETNNFVFENAVAANNVAVNFGGTSINTTLKFNNTQFITRSPYGVPIGIGDTTGTGNWNIQFHNSSVVSNWIYAFSAGAAARGSITSNVSNINGVNLNTNSFQTRGLMTFGTSTGAE